MKRLATTLITLTLVAFLLGACIPVPAPTASAPQTQPTSAAIANPASENCVKQGGTLSIVARGDGGQYGICTFEDNQQCEEWALLRGDCPDGGVKVTGYVTPAATYCAITGGTYAVTGNSGQTDEEGTCTFKNGAQCDAWDYYNGKCDQSTATAAPAVTAAPAATATPAAATRVPLGDAVATMDPQDVWQNFYELTQIPRPSHHEEQVRDFLVQFGKNLGLETIVDDVGNVLIRKPASPGMENRHGVILQAHMDMVAQPLDGTHDFLTEPIDAYVEEDWVVADGTTLGADDGSGVAVAMAVLQSKTLALGPIEALFTVDEEGDMTGALGLQPGLLQGDTLINLDSETEGEFTIGSAGGEDTDIKASYAEVAVPAATTAYTVTVSGLQGGHSGADIDKGRGHATKLLVRLLSPAAEQYGVRVTQLAGGTADNAIPTIATALVVVPNDQADAFLKYVQQYEGIVQSELAAVEPDLKVEATPAALPTKVMDEKAQRTILDALYGTPQGVIRMSDAVPGLVETSTNMGIVNVADGQAGVICLSRSSVDTELQDVAQMIASVWDLAGVEVTFSGLYSGWSPNPNSPILLLMEDVYKTIYGQDPVVTATHAGLECGTIVSKYPGMDAISIGPTLQNVHTPDERMLVASVKKLNDFLIETLKQIPEMTAQPTPTPEPTAEAAATIQPLSMEECDGEAQAMAHALDVKAATQSDAPMSDPVTGASGTGCMATVTGTGAQFQSPDAVVKTLGNMLVSQGYTADPMLAAGGPNAIDEGYRKGDQICWAGAGWQPDDSANCPKDQPVTACAVTPEQENYTVTLNCGVETSQGEAAATTGISNPASENCVQQGGTVSIVERGDGGQYGICTFADNQQCEEWALFHGACPVGGVKVTGYVTPAATYCAITGGTYVVTGNSGQADEQGTCTFKNGAQCDAWDYYNGKCDQSTATAAPAATTANGTTATAAATPEATATTKVPLGDAVATMDPQDVWQNFYDLTQIPRPSHHEEQVRDFLVQFGKDLGLETIVDDVGNVLIRKPASPGMENRHGVILQAHMDMVAQPLDGTHDFLTEPIDAYVEGDWVVADGTTLGADDGSGVATAMAILQSKTLALGPIEALFTVNEEDGMDGALGLQPGVLQGDTLINLDWETEGSFDIGSAGGDYGNVDTSYAEVETPAATAAYTVTVSGLQGGHSGVDINMGRGHATKLLVRLLSPAAEEYGVRVAQLVGGTAANAIPTSATALVVVPNDQADAFLKYVQQYQGIVQSELAATEPDLKVAATPATLPAKVMDEQAQRTILDALYGTPQGVIRMSDAVPDLVETSTNMGIVDAADGHLTVTCYPRSSVDTELDDINQMIASVWDLAGIEVTFSGRYPGWNPNPDSPILLLMEDVYKGMYGQDPEVTAVHAGLECGTIVSKYPGMDAISIGPTLQDVHTPNERMLVASVKKLNDFLIETLKQIPEK